MTLFDSFSNFATQSTIYKTHEKRHSGHQAAAQQAVAHHHPQAQDPSILTTLQKFPTRSTVYKLHEEFHQDMGHNTHAEVRHMEPIMTHHHDSLVETLASLPSESSIHERNVLRNQFLHPSDKQ